MSHAKLKPKSLMTKSSPNSLNRFTILFLTIGIMLWVEAFITIEWSCPRGINQSDGPSYAAFGMPFPYFQFSGVSSLQYNFMPHIYLLNLLLLCAIAFIIVRVAMRYLLSERHTRIRLFIGITGLALIGGRIAIIILLLSTGYFIPRRSIGIPGYESYTDFRPVGFCWNDGHYECRALHSLKSLKGTNR
jgi:hypothetical protein